LLVGTSWLRLPQTLFLSARYRVIDRLHTPSYQVATSSALARRHFFGISCRFLPSRALRFGDATGFFLAARSLGSSARGTNA
jgi:hypothetical protein